MSEFIPKNLLVVGGTGRFVGPSVTTALLDNKHFHVKVLFRKETQEKNKELIEKYKSMGAVMVEGDLNDADSLVAAMQNVDTIVSTVGGLQLMDQLKLIEAAKKVPSVKRFLPSEYGGDCSYFSPNELYYGAVIQIRKSLEESGLEYTYVIPGYFYEFATSVRYGFDHEKGELHLSGTGHEVVALTDIPDVGKFVSEILLDPYSRNQKIFIQGERTTFHSIIKTFEQVSGKQLKVTYYSAEDMKKQEEEAEGIFQKVMALLRSSIFSPAANPPFDHSSRYNVKPNTMRQYVESLYPSK